MQSCKFYQRSRCNKGSECRYSHDDSVALLQDSRRLLVCKFYQKGCCLAGDECPYSHSTGDAINAEAQFEREPVLRTMSGAVVQFGVGGTMTKLSMISDFSSARIDGFSENDATSTRLPSLLRDLGHELLPTETLRAVKLQGTSNASVYITSDDPAFAQRFCEEFRTTSVTSHLRAIAVPPKFPPGTITRHTSCRKVEVSWSRPTRAVWIHFDKYAEAAFVGGLFNREVYKLGGIALEVSTPTSHEQKWQILLRNAPLDITEARVRDAMHSPPEVPFHIMLGKTCESFDEEAAPAFIASLFKSIGSMDYMTEPRKKGRWNTAAIHFEHELDAQNAVTQLHDQPQEFLGEGKLSVRLMCTSNIKVPRKVHDAIQEQIAAALASSDKHKLSLKVYPDASPENRFVTLSLRGDGREKVANLTGDIERMLAGNAIEISNDVFTTLVENRTIAQKLKEIQTLNQVLIVTKKAKKQLVFFGPPARYEIVKQAILGLGVTAAKSKFTYQLNKAEFAWVCQGGFDQIASALGYSVVSLNMKSNPKSVIVDGSKEQYQQVRSILETLGGTIALEKMTLVPPGHESETCSTCWTPAEDPVTLVCGHVYCAECLEDLCRSSSSDNADFSVTCKGAQDTCKRTLSASELEHHLSSKAFEDILRLSFTSYIRRRANKYHYCPTPDCGFFYTCDDTTADTSTCLNCLQITCTSCHAQHGATSCADFKYERDGGDEAFNRYKEQSGGKDCPKCQTHIEKIDGCNHMTCRSCSAHICWVCLETFDRGPECYKHLTESHGGLGIDYPEDDEEDDRRDMRDFALLMMRDGINPRDLNAARLYARGRLALGNPLPIGVLARLGPFI